MGSFGTTDHAGSPPTPSTDHGGTPRDLDSSVQAGGVWSGDCRGANRVGGFVFQKRRRDCAEVHGGSGCLLLPCWSLI